MALEQIVGEEPTPNPFDRIAVPETKIIESEYMSRIAIRGVEKAGTVKGRSDLPQHTGGSLLQSTTFWTRRAEESQRPSLLQVWPLLFVPTQAY